MVEGPAEKLYILSIRNSAMRPPFLMRLLIATIITDFHPEIKPHTDFRQKCTGQRQATCVRRGILPVLPTRGALDKCGETAYSKDNAGGYSREKGVTARPKQSRRG